MECERKWCVISKPQLLGNRCDFFMLSFPVCWLWIEASENIENARATRSKVCGSLHYYMEEGCVPARNNYIGLLYVHKINFSCVKPLSFLWQLMLPSLMQVKKSCCLSFLEGSPNLVDYRTALVGWMVPRPFELEKSALPKDLVYNGCIQHLPQSADCKT